MLSDGVQNVETVASFLNRVRHAVSMLSTKDNTRLSQMDSDDPAYLLDLIARNLLDVARPTVLILGVADLPKLAETDCNDEGNEEIDDNGEESNSFPLYQYRRSDYLRLLLRLLAPVSMQVASQICSMVLHGDVSVAEKSEMEKASVLLFSHWLPVAPHLTPMVTELFQSISNPWEGIQSLDQEFIFLFAEAAYKLCSFFGKRTQIATIHGCWDWTFLFGLLNSTDVEMTEATQKHHISQFLPLAIRWFAARSLTLLLDWKPQVTLSVLKRLGLDDKRVPWEPHPWVIDLEEKDAQASQFAQKANLWTIEEFDLPSSSQVVEVLPLSETLSNMGNGILFYKLGSLGSKAKKSSVRSVETSKNQNEALIPTATTCNNLALLGAALCQEPYSPPIMVCGPHGSGKSSLIREALRLCRPGETMLEFHMDEETDSKTLIGSYSTTDVPGEFAWRPGALTLAAREGRWVLFEDVDSVPIEIQATIVKLMEDRVLNVSNGKYERCHPDFRIFGTCATENLQKREDRHSLRFSANRGGGKKILSPSLWRKVHIDLMPFPELKEVALSRYTRIPDSVVDSALALMQCLDTSGRPTAEVPPNSEYHRPVQPITNWTGGRNPSVRDFFKLLSRISNGICFEKNVTYATEAQRTMCFAESVDVFAGSCPDIDRKFEFSTQLAAPIWGISADSALNYLNSRRPTTRIGSENVEIGRARIDFSRRTTFSQRASDTFAQTNHTLRFMESIGVCVQENEPVLLVGETGCGKTSLVQQLASLCERELIVQNLSLQTDSTDLLGGYKPLELKNVARTTYQEFVDLFVSTFSRKQNAKFLQFAASALEKGDWKKLSQCFQRAAKLGTAQMEERLSKVESSSNLELSRSWGRFRESATKFERQMISCDAGLAFVFSEGALVDAIQCGKWVLLDEINLASSDTLQRLCGLLDDPTGSITLTERGDAAAINRHPNFRLFAAMNPATDAGKKDLPASIRSRFSELYVDELLDPIQLRTVAARYLASVLPEDGKPPEHRDIVISSVEVYLQCRQLAESVLTDGAGHKPRYTLRTLSRALSAAKALVTSQRIPISRAIFEGFQLAFEGALDETSVKVVRKVLKTLLAGSFQRSDLEHPGRRPGKGKDDFVLVKPFWIEAGPKETADWAEESGNGKSRFILTRSISSSLRRLSRALAAGPWPILLEGPTSAGKTTLVEYIAARCGHHVVRINNHEHTDIQEYTGSFTADQHGSLSFRDGLLVNALRCGHWVILDELNLAPSEVLEALNRLLDDNRELFLAEVNETVKPHKNFRLFATQNPSGAYGGRKPLSRAFRNRFVEIHMGDIPSDEMTTILEKRCGCPPSSAKRLVDIMIALRYQRSKNNVFLGKDSFITPRDLLRWAERRASSKLEIAQQGFMLLAERLRSNEEKAMVQSVLEEHLNVKLNMDDYYYGSGSDARKIMDRALNELSDDPLVATIAPTKSMLRLISLVATCIEQKEPVLLVGETGCGKTTVVQLLSLIFKRKLFAVNCHATTETSDLLGGLRPVRGRDVIEKEIGRCLKELVRRWPYRDDIAKLNLPTELFPEGESRDLESTSQPRDDIEKGKKVLDVDQMVALAQTICASRPPIFATAETEMHVEERNKKRQKLSTSNHKGDSAMPGKTVTETLQPLLNEIEVLARRHASLFEWSDGPLVAAMKQGQMLLLDEMSLAEDAVLERLNSVLEPSRTLVLAEKADDGSNDETRVIVAHDNFRVFATMNPGGDFGKRELSPALRSRFTEIWVPAITEKSDYELVLDRTLRSGMDHTNNESVLQQMLAYVDWFNNTICKDQSIPSAGISLSLRDVLSWARFLVSVRRSNKHLGLWDAYAHGAALMHLDGLGLGSGLAVEDVAAVRRTAEAFLSTQIPEGVAVDTRVSASFAIRGGEEFGAMPFLIPVGKVRTPNLQFDMGAPTTSSNAFRVLRAMQLSKPILLEGSPGVGKTSLITALAAASGNKLVRINLSEQTDISDLMGSDLPVQSSTPGGASFEWCDGIFLSAIKEGSWVLLDELNLASQSVLEGLNSCLDHRGAIFIPEIGQTFFCPPTFRVFGAQNPLGQGGGRKGLPKSFLNRFTKVYVDALTSADLRAIVTSQYPTIDISLVNKVLAFNDSVHNDVVIRREYGSEGSPWEFNLRDVFRWCQLYEKHPSSMESSVRDLYYQRFRSADDRRRLDLCFKEHFGVSLQPQRPPKFIISESGVTIGDTTLPRLKPSNGTLQRPFRQEPEICHSQMLQMEAVARCVSFRWPCLLIGPSASGKTSIVAALAELCNATLIQKCLSPSSDVTEILGCFEQVESNEFEQTVAQRICDIVDEFFFHHICNSVGSAKIWQRTIKLKSMLGTNSESLIENVKSLSKDLMAVARAENLEFQARLHSLINLIESRSSTENNDRNGAGHFIWRDGALVEAMTHGHWLVLENVNLCPSSVLDRLNSVMEKDGELLLSECGTSDGPGNASHRVIKPHPNFRIFLSMNGVHGEISRAMRNRCVELYIPLQFELGPDISECTVSPETKIDLLGKLHAQGLRVLEVGNHVLKLHVDDYRTTYVRGEELPNTRVVAESMSMASTMMLRGIHGSRALMDFQKIAYELRDETLHRTPRLDSSWRESTSMFRAGSVSEVWLQDPPQAQAEWASRFLRLFPRKKDSLLSMIAQIGLLDSRRCSNDMSSKLQLLENATNREIDVIDFVEAAIKKYLCGGTVTDVRQRMSFLDGFRSSFEATFRWMTATLEKEFRHFEESALLRPLSAGTGASSTIFQFQRYLERRTLLVYRNRLDQSSRENRWLCKLTLHQRLPDLPVHLTVLDASFLLNDSILDRTSVSCPVTPLIYPLFNELDELLKLVLSQSIFLNQEDDERLALDVASLLVERDQFWRLMHETPLSLTGGHFLGFEESEFLVQWKWFKKALRVVNMNRDLMGFEKSAQKVDSLVSLFDGAIFGGPPPSKSIRAIQKAMIRPLVFRDARHWAAISQIRKVAVKCSLSTDGHFSHFMEMSSGLELSSLLHQEHPLLFVGTDFRTDLLALLSTQYASWTDEFSVQQNGNVSMLATVLEKKVQKMLEAKRRKFLEEVARVRADTSISTIESQYTGEQLEELDQFSHSSTAGSEAYINWSSKMLSSFAAIQLSALSEYWCLQEERRLIGEICRCLSESKSDQQLFDRLRKSSVALKRFTSTCLSSVVWSVSDLRPYQTLSWVVDNWSRDMGGLASSVRSLLAPILASRNHRTWCNSFYNLSKISIQLEVPNMWHDDEALGYVKKNSIDREPSCWKSARILDFIKSEYMIRILGGQLTLHQKERKTKFFTIENYGERLVQYRAITKVMAESIVHETKPDLLLLHFLTVDMMKVVRDGIAWCDLDPLIKISTQPSILVETNLSHFKDISRTLVDRKMQELFETLLLPLVKHIQECWRVEESSEQYINSLSVAWVHLGLLQLHIATPASPLDPGVAPVAKTSLINRRLADLNTQVAVTRYHSGFECGDFFPVELASPLADGELLIRRRNALEKKIIQRPIDAPPFSELFREAQSFTKRVMSPNIVLAMITSVFKDDDKSAIRRKVENWNEISSAFCHRLDLEYSSYEDVTVGIANAIRMIQGGFEVLMKNTDGKSGQDNCLFELLVQYPMKGYEQLMQLICGKLSSLGTSEVSTSEGHEIQFALCFTALTHMLHRKQILGLTKHDVSQCYEVLSNLGSGHSQLIPSTDSDKPENLEDLQEKNFREQFPDHKKEFSRLFDEDHELSEEQGINDAPALLNHKSSDLSDQQLELLCFVTEGLFSNDQNLCLEKTRALAFHSSYNTACLLERIFGITKQTIDRTEPICGHIHAMAISIPPTVSTRVFPHLHSEATIVDFQNEPNPNEVKSAKAPLQRLMARTTQLLTAFPGHSILLGIGRVCDKVCKFDMMITPIGKVLSGLEVLLRQAQEWEQHASSRVCLGEPLKEIGKLVAKWRKLELESWPQLILARKKRQERKVHKHFFRLQKVLHSVSTDDENTSTHALPKLGPNSSTTLTPAWIWKGVVSEGKALCSPLESSDGNDLTELTKVLDTFILTSSIGQFQERLQVLKTCGIQLETEYNNSRVGRNWKMQRSRVLLSVCSYYSQFLPAISTKLDTMIAPLQSKLRDEVKLAKWDEQTYYSLAESTERNHRKLMKILSEVDECLELNAGQLIQGENIRGVRANVESNEEISTSVPSSSMFFPQLQKEETGRQMSTVESVPFHRGHMWVEAVDIPGSTNRYVNRMKQYAKKMETRLTGHSLEFLTCATMGFELSSSLSEDIFSRIEVLRTKSTRPMKERALVDLFRELRRNGFSTMKWSVPPELRQIEQLFQLPSPDIEQHLENVICTEKLRKGELYYQRCVAELSTFRAECLQLGSRQMSKSEIDKMLALGESGMLLIAQQRCVVGAAVKEHEILKRRVSSLIVEDGALAVPQSSIILMAREFDVAYRLSLESLRQLSHHLKLSPRLLDDTVKIEWARDSVAKVEHCTEKLVENLKDPLPADEVLTLAKWRQIKATSDILVNAKETVSDCKDSCVALSCLPADCFDVTLESLEQAISSVRHADPSEHTEKGDISSFISSLSTGVERALISFQNFVQSVPNEGDNVESGKEAGDSTLWLCHKTLTGTWASANLKSLNDSLLEVVHELQHLYNTVENDKSGERAACVKLISDLHVLASYVEVVSHSLLEKTAAFYSSSTKLVYIVLRVFRVLVAKGYCSDETADDDESGEGGDANGMTFEDDQEGTGMGEGDGKRDVTDQLENEDQLSGLKTDNGKEEKNEKQESRQLNEDEADQGMEMEADFDGELCDVPEKPEAEDTKDQDEEELDREMGEEGSPDEQVVDERMWNDSDDENEIDKGEEKFEKDSGVEGEAIEGATRTKDDNEEGGKDEKKPSGSEAGKDDDIHDLSEEDDVPINEDAEDRYEDAHGVDVQENENEGDANENADQMQLEDEIDLDGADNVDEGEGNDENGTSADYVLEDGSDLAENSMDVDPNAEDEQDDEGENTAEIAAAPPGSSEPMEGEDTPSPEDGQEAEDECPIELESNQQAEQQAHGIRSKSGGGAITEEEEGEPDDDEAAGDTTGAAQAKQAQSDGNGGSGFSEQNGAVDESNDSKQAEGIQDIPNPFKDLGDASKFWHRKLNIVDSSPENEVEESQPADSNLEDTDIDQATGDFQYTSQEQDRTTQVLGEAMEEEEVELKQPEQSQSKHDEQDNREDGKNKKKQESKKLKSEKQRTPHTTTKHDVQEQKDEDSEIADEHQQNDIDEAEDNDAESVGSTGSQSDDKEKTGNQVVSDLSRLHLVEDGDTPTEIQSRLIEEEHLSKISSSDAANARTRWLQIQGDTFNLSRRLCEKLRLVMEPLVASKLRGDYRSGKRINMKRVIGYIASGYRKDKIWLRRTKPAKRDYRVLLAVDDSESMKKSGAGEMALRALATLAVGMNQLEIGELGIASFGEDMKLLHPFHMPFTSESGADMVMNFQFDQQRTRTSLCVESAIATLGEMGSQSSMQLVFLISDGRIERDSRNTLKRLIREMMERNILLAMIIVEGEHKQKDSIVQMKEVTFEKGKPVVKRFIEDYPFPYYIVLDDMTTLPEVLGDALRQWFEMLGQLQSPR